MFQLHESEEFQFLAYENAKLYKEKKKKTSPKCNDQKEKAVSGQQVLLFDPRLKLFPRKLRSRRFGPYTVNPVLANGPIELETEDG